MNPSPKSAAKQAKLAMYRRLILEAAEGEFARRGYDDAKIQDIAQAAGIALGTLYTVFPGKQEIYDAIQQLRGREVLEHISSRVHGAGGLVEACLAGVDAYVRCLALRPDYLRMHLREGLSWTDRSGLRTGDQIATWEQGIALAAGLLRSGAEQGLFYGDNPPELAMKMLISAHQAQLQDWVERGADENEIDALIERMQAHFLRAFVTPEAAANLRERAAEKAV